MKSFSLDEVTQIYSGATPATNNKIFYEGGTIPWITPKDLSGYKFKYIFSGQRNITDKGYSSCATTLVPKGTVLLSSRAPIGYVAIAGNELCTNQGFKNFVCDERYLLNHYLYYYLIKYKNRIESLGNGSTFKEISRKTISQYQIDLPSVCEQKKAVKELVSLDEKYDANCVMLTKIEELLMRYYSKYYECNINQNDLLCIGSVADIISGGTPSTKNESYWNSGVYYWYTPSDITTVNNIFSYEAKQKISISGLTNSSAKLVPAKSVLMTSRATIGEAIITMSEATTNQGILSLVPKYDQIDSMVLYFWIKKNRSKIISVSNGSTFKEVYKKDLEKLKIYTSKSAINSFKEKTDCLITLYENLVKENGIINELKQYYLNIRI